MSVPGDIGAAFGWLTIVPVPAAGESRPARWFPLVGWALGGVACAVALGVTKSGTGSPGALLGGAIIVSAWAAVSRMLHWDGVADSADGLLGGHSAERRLEIMHDSRTGAFGVTAIVMLALLQVAACGVLVQAKDVWPLLAAPVLGRFSATAGLWTLGRARSEGLAARLPASEGLLAWAVAIGLCLPLLVGAGVARVAVVAAGMLASVLLPRLLAKPVGGVSGDLLGAAVVLVETGVLVLCALLTGVLV